MLRLLSDDIQGATAIEYGLLVALIALVLIGALTAIGSSLSDNFIAIGNVLDD